VIVFIDDILIYSKTKEEHDEHLRTVLQTLRENQLYAKFSKCEFYQDKVQYSGHVISGEGISIDPKKVKAILYWPVPKDVSDVLFFMGFTTYHHSFIEGFCKLAYPITILQNKGIIFKWTEKKSRNF